MPPATPARCPRARPPVSIEQCGAEQQSTTNPNLKVDLAFRNLRTSDALHVEFDISMLDGDDKPVDTRTVSIDGKFAPNVLIEPRRASITSALLAHPEYPDSPAWIIPNHFGSRAQRVRCEVHAATFVDGTTWNRPKS